MHLTRLLSQSVLKQNKMQEIRTSRELECGKCIFGTLPPLNILKIDSFLARFFIPMVRVKADRNHNNDNNRKQLIITINPFKTYFVSGPMLFFKTKRTKM